MINPSVFNADRSQEFIAVVVYVLSAGLSQVDKRSDLLKDLSKVVAVGVHNRYFLKEDNIESEVRSLSGLPTSELRNQRCCT